MLPEFISNLTDYTMDHYAVTYNFINVHRNYTI